MLLKIVLLIFCVISNEVLAEECGKCEWSECEPLGYCGFGVTPDICGCCEVCTQGLGEKCDYVPEGEKLAKSVNGICGDFLECSKTNICECSEEGQVCGSDDVTYESVCELMVKANDKNDITVFDRAACRKGPLIKSPPKDSARPIGSILVLDCEAAGFPVPNISWELYRPDGSTIQLPNDNSFVAVQVRGGPEKNMATGWVQIMKILPENIGIYTCIAKNAEGEDKASANVSIKKGKVPKKAI